MKVPGSAKDQAREGPPKLRDLCWQQQGLRGGERGHGAEAEPGPQSTGGNPQVSGVVLTSSGRGKVLKGLQMEALISRTEGSLAPGRTRPDFRERPQERGASGPHARGVPSPLCAVQGPASGPLSRPPPTPTPRWLLSSCLPGGPIQRLRIVALATGKHELASGGLNSQFSEMR